MVKKKYFYILKSLEWTRDNCVPVMFCLLHITKKCLERRLYLIYTNLWDKYTPLEFFEISWDSLSPRSTERVN
jgi:hypothetical protein